MTTYSSKSNAARAAKKFFGATAEAGVTFQVVQAGEGWTFESIPTVLTERTAEDIAKDIAAGAGLEAYDFVEPTTAPAIQAQDKGDDFNLHCEDYRHALASAERIAKAKEAEEARVAAHAEARRNAAKEIDGDRFVDRDFTQDFTQTQAYQGARDGRGAGLARLKAAPEADALREAVLEDQQGAMLAVRKRAIDVAKLADLRAPAPVEKEVKVGELVAGTMPKVEPGQHKPGSKGALLVELMSRPEGWTDDELSAHLNQKHAISPAFHACARVGLQIMKRREGRTVRYFTAPVVMQQAAE